ncbi:MAG: DUF4105 domain-containing protein [Niabella sp.]|nr:DUF4105 domain-containing protein [Niabella sp.]
MVNLLQRGLLFSLMCISLCAHAQLQSEEMNAANDRLRISILTCAVGDELYASFGHTAVRVVDSTAGTDVVYNYGTFDFNDPDFYTKFTLGKLLYFLDKENFRDFIQSYSYESRGVTEQVLQLTLSEKEQILRFLEKNLLPENRAYRYDFLFDNCATRVRDIFPNVLGAAFSFGPVLGNTTVSYRRVIDQYLENKHWERLGIDLILGSPVDKQMTARTALFLPDYLFKSLQGATYKGEPFAITQTIVPGKTRETGTTVNMPFIVFSVFFLLLGSGFLLPRLKRLRNLLCSLVLIMTGLLGLQLLFMWLATDHQSCKNNWNVLWAIPFNIALPFFTKQQSRFLRRYAILGILLLIAAVIVHCCGIQKMPFSEITPLLLCLLLAYSNLYIKQKQFRIRKRRQVSSSSNAEKTKRSA